jgi:hypothetical protein
MFIIIYYLLLLLLFFIFLLSLYFIYFEPSYRNFSMLSKEMRMFGYENQRK